MKRAEKSPTTARSSRSIFFGLAASRVLGLIRDRAVFAIAGLSTTNDMLTVALKVANTLQNLLGEQSLSASFIPAYTERLGAARIKTPEEARRLAGAVFARLLIIAGMIGLAGSLLAPLIGLSVAKRGPEAVTMLTLAIRFLFPMAAVLVMAAWCLSVLNSHRRFFLPYLAPVFWNLGILTSLLLYTWVATDGSPQMLVLYFSVGSLVGGFLQLGVQLPAAVRANGGLPLTLSGTVPGLQEIQRRFLPVFMGRGSLQVIGVFEVLVAGTFLSEGTASGLGQGQRLFFLTIMVTSMVQAIVYLPEFSRIKDSSVLRIKFREALHGVWFLVVPTTLGVVALGYPLVAAIFRSERMREPQLTLLYLTFAIYVLGLIPTASSRILQTALYSRGETRLPAIVGAVRSASSLTVAMMAMRWWDGLTVDQLSDWFHVAMPPSTLTLGALAFASSSALAAYGEWFFLRHRGGVEGSLGLFRKGGLFAGLSICAFLPTLAAWWGFRQVIEPGLILLKVDMFFVGQGVLVIGVFAAGYLLLARQLRIEEFERLAGPTVARTKP